MKANEAPEKIYINSNLENRTWLIGKGDISFIEYTRIDAFIEKAVEWLSANADKYIWYSNYAENIGDDTCGMNDDFIEDFEKYMKGE